MPHHKAPFRFGTVVVQSICYLRKALCNGLFIARSNRSVTRTKGVPSLPTHKVIEEAYRLGASFVLPKLLRHGRWSSGYTMHCAVIVPDLHTSKIVTAIPRRAAARRGGGHFCTVRALMAHAGNRDERTIAKAAPLRKNSRHSTRTPSSCSIWCSPAWRPFKRRSS